MITSLTSANFTQMLTHKSLSNKSQANFLAILTKKEKADSPAKAPSLSQLNLYINSSTDQRLEEIGAKDPFSRTLDDMSYRVSHDPTLAEISAKRSQNFLLTAEEIDYEQKARGFVNTMAYLSADELALYNELGEQGNTTARNALANIASIRVGGHEAVGFNGVLYNPCHEAITADNIRKYFQFSIIDDSGKTQTEFDALIDYLETTRSAAFLNSFVA